MKQTISDVLRGQVFKRDRYTCRYCGFTGGPLHADHVYPESKGGETTLENLVTSCPNCNQKKSNKVGMWPMPLEHAQLSSSERYYQKAGQLVYYAFLGDMPLEDRVRGIKATYPKLSARDIAVIAEASPAYVSEVLNTVDAEVKQ